MSFGTSDAGATAGQDYTANNGVLTFGANETTKTITIQIANDTTYEVSEGFKVTLSAADQWRAGGCQGSDRDHRR